MTNNIEERIKKIVSKQLRIKQEKIMNTDFFNQDLGADSLDIVELFMALEQEFNIEITDETADQINTVQSAINYIKNIVNED
ncbi:MAG: acyl carrier protein [Candidatus Dasytiphilus stammeri]